jgi:hypothetical protein
VASDLEPSEKCRGSGQQQGLLGLFCPSTEASDWPENHARDLDPPGNAQDGAHSAQAYVRGSTVVGIAKSVLRREPYFNFGVRR